MRMINEYLKHGFVLMPLEGKKPILKNWTNLGYDPLFESLNGNNFGVVLQDCDLIVDVDNWDSYYKLCGDLELNIEDSFRVRTGSGGMHIYLKKDPEFLTRKIVKEYDGIHFLGKGAHCVGASSLHPETQKPYTAIGSLSTILEAPFSLLEVLKKVPIETPQIEIEYQNDTSTQFQYIQWLLSTPLTATFTVACKGRDFGLPPETTLKLMAEHWNQRRSPVKTIDQLGLKVDHAYKYAKNAIGNLHPKAEFTEVPVEILKKKKEAVLKWDVDNNGKLKNTFLNAVSLLSLPEFSIYESLRFNLFTHDVEVSDKLPWRVNQSISPLWTDTDAINCRYLLSAVKRFNASLDNVHQAAVIIANQHTYHPVLDYFNSLQWDGKLRIDTWLKDYCGAIDTEYTKLVGSKMLIAAVGRVLKPGIKFDYIPIIEGAQGIGKSTLCKILGGEWFGDVSLDLNNLKDTVETLRGKWILELSELEVLKRTDISKLKQFISCEKDRVRLPYRRNAEDFPRQSIFIGTINPENKGYLTDPTGNRRFWPIHVTKVKFDQIQEVRDQLFAEAIVRFKKGEKIYIDYEHNELFAKEVNERMHVDIWEETIQRYTQTHKSQFYSTEELLVSALGIPIGSIKIGCTEARRVASCMKRLKYESKIVKDRGISTRRWVKVEDENV